MRQIVLLSHQGGSFIEKLVHAASQLGLDAVVVSSQFDNNGHVAGALANAKVLPESDLTFSSVKEFIDTETQISEIEGFISVWEGYRPLMAALNNQYGFNDISEEVAWRLRDKLAVRNFLRGAGLSETNAQVASRRVLETRLNNRTRSGSVFPVAAHSIQGISTGVHHPEQSVSRREQPGHPRFLPSKDLAPTGRDVVRRP